MAFIQLIVYALLGENISFAQYIARQNNIVLLIVVHRSTLPPPPTHHPTPQGPTMSETTYSIENAKSGRASCKKCKEKIGKGEIRLGVSAPGPSDYNVQRCEP